MEKKDSCPHCGSENTTTAHIRAKDIRLIRHAFESTPKSIHTVICRECGTIIRFFIENPHEWA